MEQMITTVFYPDYPDIRVIVRHGWRIVNEAAELGGKVLLLDG